MSNQPPILALLIPCYNEEALIADTVKILDGYLRSLIKKNAISSNSLMVFVDDGSKDATYAILRKMKTQNYCIIKLASNKGHQYALLAGMKYVTNKVDCVISIDADLQDDINAIEAMLEKYMQGFHIVYGVRRMRATDSIFKKSTAYFFYWIMRKMGAPVISNHADFRLLSQKTLFEFERYKETNLFLRGMLPLINLQSTVVYYNRAVRAKGQTKYTLRKMASLAINGITSFSIIPIRLITILGAIIFLITMLLSVNVIAVYLKGKVVPGWASITLPLYFLGGIQLLSIGIIGEYIAKIYKETKRRPHYHIEEIIE